MSIAPSTSTPTRRACAFAGAALAAMLVLPPMASASAVEPTVPPAAAETAPPETAPAEAPQPETAQAAAEATEGSAFKLSSASALYKSELTVNYSTDQPHSENWIGIYNAADSPGGPASRIWEYTPEAEGSVVFTLDLAPGTYHVWFLAKGGYDELTEMQVLTVEADPTLPSPGNPNAPVEIDPVTTDLSTDGVILRETFNGAATPEGWGVSFDASGEGDAAYAGWKFSTRAEWSSTVDEMRDRFGRTDGAFAVADAQQFGDHDFAATLTSQPIDVTGLGAIGLSFDSHYRGAANQSGVVLASFDGADAVEVLRLDSTTVTDGYDGMEMNGAHELTVDTPSRAKSVVFSWEFTGDTDARYWAIDSVTAHLVLTPTANEPTQAWVVSDIQGHPADFAHGIEDFSKISPNADGLLMVGDIVNSGSIPEWDEIYDVMNASEDVRPRQTIAGMGNHERYAAGGFDVNFKRFLDFAERDKSWGEYVLEGPSGQQPVIVLGQEFSGPTDVPMSDAQVEFLEERLAYWTALDKQVVIMSHFPLGNTVSASWLPGYSKHHQHNARLTSILGNYPNAIIMSGHTHYPAELGDWAMQRKTADGHADGFWAVNTLAMHIEWDVRGENTQGVREITTGDVNRGLTLDSYGDRVVITAYDFATDTQLRQVTIPNPLVPYAGELAADADRDANYAEVDAALAEVPVDLSGYTDASVETLQAAIIGVDRTLAADRQSVVDGMATAIREAIAGLQFTPAEGGTGPDSGAGSPDGAGSTDGQGGAAGGAGQGSGAKGGSLASTGSTEAGGLIAVVLGLLAAGGALVLTRRRKAAGQE